MEDASPALMVHHEPESLEESAPSAATESGAPEAPPLDAPVVQVIPAETEELSAAQIIEALLFASDTPLSANRIAELLGAGSATDVRRQIDALNEKYAAVGLSFRIEPIARGYQMMTTPAFKPWLAKLDKQRSQTRLSEAALEVLSIIAYKQPIIRADIEAIRGVACGDLLHRLKDMGLIRIVGRAEIVGRPILYGTTRKFLDVFGLSDLEDLPPMEALALRRAPAPALTPPPPEPAPAPAAAAGA